jgi:hypothetical protein
VDEASLVSDELLAVPGIYQARVPKAHELRIAVMGSHAFAAKLSTPELDFRTYRDLDVRPADPAPDVERMCLAMMERLGLRFGCFDFLVTPDGRPVFLEVNQDASFLWVEMMCGMPLLDAFTAFLLRREPEGLRYEDIEVAARMDEAYRRHVVPAGPFQEES